MFLESVPRPLRRASAGALARLLGRTAEEKSGKRGGVSDKVFEMIIVQETSP